MDQISKSRELRLHSESGFGFAQLIVVLPIILIIMASASTYFFQKLIMNTQVRARENFAIHKQNLTTDLTNELVWDETLAKDHSPDCLVTGPCLTLEKQDFVFYNLEGKPLTGPDSPGYRLDGSACATADDECPIKWEFKWRPMCADLAACAYDSEVEFAGHLINSQTEEVPINLDRFKIIIYRKLF